jgi:hypothetical protein
LVASKELYVDMKRKGRLSEVIDDNFVQDETPYEPITTTELQMDNNSVDNSPFNGGFSPS